MNHDDAHPENDSSDEDRLAVDDELAAVVLPEMRKAGDRAGIEAFAEDYFRRHSWELGPDDGPQR